MSSRLTDLEKEIAEAERGREDTTERKELFETIISVKDKRQTMQARLKDFADNDPVVLEQMVKETKEAVEAVNRWTDNIFSIQGWIKKKFPGIDQVLIIENLVFLLKIFVGILWEAVWYPRRSRLP